MCKTKKKSQYTCTILNMLSGYIVITTCKYFFSETESMLLEAFIQRKYTNILSISQSGCIRTLVPEVGLVLLFLCQPVLSPLLQRSPESTRPQLCPISIMEDIKCSYLYTFILRSILIVLVNAIFGYVTFRMLR